MGRVFIFIHSYTHTHIYIYIIQYHDLKPGGGVFWTRFFPTNQLRVEFSSGQSLSMPALPPWSGKAWDMLMLLRVHTNRNKPNYPNISKLHSLLHSYIVDSQATPAHCEQSWTIRKFRTPFRHISPSHLRGPSTFQCRSWLPPGIAYGGALLRCVRCWPWLDSDSGGALKKRSHAVLVCSVWWKTGAVA